MSENSVTPSTFNGSDTFKASAELVTLTSLDTAQDAKNAVIAQQNETPATPTGQRFRAAGCHMV